MIEAIQIHLRPHLLLSRPLREDTMIGKLDEALGFHQTALSLRAQRQQVLASNIANADTPHYKARDIDFAKALQGALAKSDASGGGLAKTAKGHVDGSKAAKVIGGAPLLYRTVQQGSVDGNTVDMDVERNQFLDNALRYEAGVSIIGQQIKNLLAAVQG
jgi:flagellar basal-body rod protein FlgB